MYFFYLYLIGGKEPFIFFTFFIIFGLGGTGESEDLDFSTAGEDIGEITGEFGFNKYSLKFRCIIIILSLGSVILGFIFVM